MPDLTHQQQEALEAQVRLDLYELLSNAEGPMTLSLIGAQKPFRKFGLDQIKYHLLVLINVDLVVLESAHYRAIAEASE